MNPEFSVDRFAVVMDRAPRDFKLFADLFVRRASGEMGGNIKLPAGQVTTGFTIKKTKQFWHIGFGAACSDGGLTIEGLF